MGTNPEQLKIEARIREVNRTVLRNVLPQVTDQELEKAIIFVAAVRAQYLKAVVQMTQPEEMLGEREREESLFNRLTELRRNYTEAVAALDALRHAFDQGYIDIEG